LPAVIVTNSPPEVNPIGGTASETYGEESIVNTVVEFQELLALPEMKNQVESSVAPRAKTTVLFFPTAKSAL
jgi:hypothetical protein